MFRKKKDVILATASTPRGDGADIMFVTTKENILVTNVVEIIERGSFIVARCGGSHGGGVFRKDCVIYMVPA